MVLKQKLFLCLLIFALNVSNSFGQQVTMDTTKLTRTGADSLFLTRNLLLLSEKFNIDASRALIIQSRLWDNPTLNLNQNIYNPETATTGGRKWFDMSDKGETNAQIQQLIVIAGKRNKRINLAELAARKEEQSYFDLMRTLKYSMRSGFYNIYYQLQIIKVYDKEISSIARIITVFETQLEKGYTSKMEVLRLKSNLFSLENEKLNYISQLNSSEADFNMIMHTSGVVYVPIVTDVVSFKSPDSVKLQVLIDSAYNNRYDLKMTQTDYDISKLNLAYQKSLAVPDITLAAGWDRNGSFVHNYNYVGLQVDLPFFNRNQGNIKSARFTQEGNKYKLQNYDNQVRTDVIQSFSTLTATEKMFDMFNIGFINDLEKLIDEITRNYEKRNISLIEFLDYYNAYKENAVQLNNLLYHRSDAYENLNFNVGKDIMNN